MRRLLLLFGLAILLCPMASRAQSSASSPAAAAATAASVSAIGPVFNVLSYGYKADWRQNSAADGTCSGGTPNLGSATIAFSQADVGKHVVVFVSGNSTIGGGDLTIASVQSATAATLSGNIPTCGSSGSYSIDVFSDNGPALNNAETACVASGGMISLPAGDAGVVTRFWFNNSSGKCAYVGQGANFALQNTGVTTIHISPWTPFSGNRILSFGGYGEMRGINFDGMQAAWPNVANNAIVTWSGPTILDHVAFNNFAFVASTNTICNINTDNVVAYDLECGANGFPGPGGTALLVHSLNFTCVSCVMSGLPAVTATDIGNSAFIGGTFQGLGGSPAFNLTGSSGGGKNNVLSDAHLTCTGTSAANACIVFTTNTTMDLTNVTFDNQGTSNVIALNVPSSMTVPTPSVAGMRARGTGTGMVINVAGILRDGGANDNFTLTGGGQILGNNGSNSLLLPCAAVGTGASPSVVSCGGASSGLFSCATNATGATCQVNTTAVTASSVINVIEDDTTTTGTKLGVTCNTSTTVTPTARLVASATAGTGFVLNMGTITTNPACFGYTITN